VNRIGQTKPFGLCLFFATVDQTRTKRMAEHKADEDDDLWNRDYAGEEEDGDEDHPRGVWGTGDGGYYYNDASDEKISDLASLPVRESIFDNELTVNFQDVLQPYLDMTLRLLTEITPQLDRLQHRVDELTETVKQSN
jgi:hypothetical protein